MHQGKDQIAERLPGVHAPAVDVRARRLAREATIATRELELRAKYVEKVLRVRAVVDGEGRVKTDLLAV
jgi:hypothetical protein